MQETAITVLNYLFSQPISSISEISKKSEKAYNTISNILKHFVKLNFVSKNIINKRNKIYRFESYLALLEKKYSD